MASKQRMTELRITRNGTQRHRSLCGGTVIGDYVDPANGERVLTVKTVSVVRPAQAKSKKRKEPNAGSFPPGVAEAPGVLNG